MGILKGWPAISILDWSAVTQTNDPMGILKVVFFEASLGTGAVTQTNDPMGILKASPPSHPPP